MCSNHAGCTIVKLQIETGSNASLYFVTHKKWFYNLRSPAEYRSTNDRCEREKLARPQSIVACNLIP